MNYVPLQVKTHYSLLKSPVRPTDLLEHCKKHKFPSVAITDYGSIGGCVNIFKTFKDSGIKPILGTTLHISQGDSTDKSKNNHGFGYLTLLAKNKAGWSELIKITSYCNDPIRWCNHPRLSLEELTKFNLKNLICISGGLNSVVSNTLFENKLAAFHSSSESQSRNLLKEDFSHNNPVISLIRDSFGDDFYLELPSNGRPMDAAVLEEWNKIDCKKIVSPDSHYLNPEDTFDQRILLCSAMDTTMLKLEEFAPRFDDGTCGRFFLSNNYGLPPDLITDNALALSNTFEINEKCETYDILSKPTLPQFPCPEGMTDVQTLRQLCRDGWKARIMNKVDKKDEPTYAERIKYELDVIEDMGFSSYFLILNDIITWTKSKGQLVGPARGSAAGSLASYLSYITSINPLKHDLIFERFLNPARKSMPDIDFDVPSEFRGEVLEYISNRYGKQNVCEMITYQTYKGRSSLKEVLRAYGNIANEVMNEITEPIPDEASISDDLQEMKEEEGESSIIMWALENAAKKLEAWCTLESDGSLSGPLAKRFEQAIRLEGIKKSQGRHPAGIVISPKPFGELCPLVYDKKEDCLVAGLDMVDIESIGLVKMDCLGVTALDKIQSTCRSLRGEE